MITDIEYAKYDRRISSSMFIGVYVVPLFGGVPPSRGSWGF
jgi:hypothetical protein